MDLECLREDPEEFEVIEIVEQRRVKHRNRYRLMYKCRWEHYGITDEWIPEAYLRNAREVLVTWKTKLKEQNLLK